MIFISDPGAFLGVNESADSLVHEVAENSFVEFEFQGSDLVRTTTWTTAGMTTKIRETLMTYQNGLVTEAEVRQFTDDGDLKTTLTKTLNYSPQGVLTSVLVERVDT